MPPFGLQRMYSYFGDTTLVTPGMESPISGKRDIHSEDFLRLLMRRQLRLSITCAATFLVALLGLPLLNYFFPELMATRIFGFTLTWFLLGVLFFPLVWLISWFFIHRSIALEEREAVEAAGEQGRRGEKENVAEEKRGKGEREQSV